MCVCVLLICINGIIENKYAVKIWRRVVCACVQFWCHSAYYYILFTHILCLLFNLCGVVGHTTAAHHVPVSIRFISFRTAAAATVLAVIAVVTTTAAVPTVAAINPFDYCCLLRKVFCTRAQPQITCIRQYTLMPLYNFCIRFTPYGDCTCAKQIQLKINKSAYTRILDRIKFECKQEISCITTSQRC